ncbi:MAG: AAA family ATPase [Clostridia bacterium]|nr:AAA family ATPase [Clostridia bacterium]
MNKPKLLIITGRCGAGKTTLSELMMREYCMPLVSRDRVKEGLVHTSNEVDNLKATESFFSIIKEYLKLGVSLIAEAAFQHAVWEKFLEDILPMADAYLIICTVDPDTALDRFIGRGLTDSNRERFHSDKGVKMFKEGIRLTPSVYAEPNLGIPTIHVNTENGYEPSVGEIKEKILGELSQDY